MRHLEIKHLAPYLPYGLKLQYVVREKVEHIGTMKSIDHNENETHPTRVGIDYYDKEHIWMFKPILRKISDITDIERKQLFNLVFGRVFPDNGGQVFIDKKPSRWVLSSGLDRLGIQENGEVWYDCDLIPFKFNQHLVTLFFLEKHFDLFGLIEDELATEVSKQISI